MLVSCVVSVLLAIGGTYYVLNRKPAETTPSSAERKPGILPPPVALPALAYLPSNTNVVAGFSPGPLVVYAEVNNTTTDKLLADSGLPKVIPEALKRLGVPLNQIDHVVAGLGLAEDNAIPQVTVVLVLKGAMADEAEFWKAIGAERVSGGARPKYKATFGGLPTVAVRVTPTVVVFSTEAQVVDKISGERPPSVEHFSPGLKDTLATKLSPASFLWLATGTKDQWAKSPTVQLALTATNRKDLLAWIARGQALAVGLSLEPDPWIQVAVKADNGATAMALSDYLATQWAGDRTEVETTRDDWSVVKAFCPLADTAKMLDLFIPKPK
jgi:hypothetical protein